MDVDWLKARKKDRGVTDAALAEALGVERSVANKVANGKVTMNARRADAVGQLLGVTRDEVLFRAGLSDEQPAAPRAPAMPSARDDDDTAEIIALDLSLSMGPGTFIEDFVDGEPVRISLGFIQAITRTPTDRLRLVKGIGDSMEPTLRTGDQVLVDINERQLSRINGIYWIDYLGMHGIKRLRAAGQGKLNIGSDNPLVPDFEVDAADVRIEGRVIWFAREL